MFRLQVLAACLLAYFAFGSAGPASFIKPCKPDDAVCQKENIVVATPYFVKGIPELDLPPADPIVLNDVRADEKDLKLGFRNMKVTGIAKCQLVDFSRDLEKSTMTLVEECPVSATGQYDVSGKLLTFPIEGDGDFIIKTDKARITVTMKIKVVEKDDGKHWKVTGYDYSYDILDKASITLHNLYGGDEARAKPIRDVLDSSPAELIKELGGQIVKELVGKEVNIVNKFFKAMPISELELS